MPKTIVFRDNSHLDQLVLGDVHIHNEPCKAEPKPEPKQNRDIEDVTFEEINTYCRYLDFEAIKQRGIRTPAEVQANLEEKSKEDARVFVTFLREQIGLGYINFHDDKIATVFDNLHDDLPMMRNYSKNNFYTYFRDEPL